MFGKPYVYVAIATLIISVTYGACVVSTQGPSDTTSDIRTLETVEKECLEGNAIAIPGVDGEIPAIVGNPCCIWEYKACKTQECFAKYKQCWIKHEYFPEQCDEPDALAPENIKVPYEQYE